MKEGKKKAERREERKKQPFKSDSCSMSKQRTSKREIKQNDNLPNNPTIFFFCPVKKCVPFLSIKNASISSKKRDIIFYMNSGAHLFYFKVKYFFSTKIVGRDDDE